MSVCVSVAEGMERCVVVVVVVGVVVFVVGVVVFVVLVEALVLVCLFHGQQKVDQQN